MTDLGSILTFVRRLIVACVALVATSSCAKTPPIGLRGLAVVELEQAAESRAARDWTCADRRCLGRDELVAQTLVRPLLMIVLDKGAYGSPEMPFAEEDDPLQALGLALVRFAHIAGGDTFSTKDLHAAAATALDACAPTSIASRHSVRGDN
jgi:hypothetical protein